MDYTNDFLIHKIIVYVFVFVCFIHFVASHYNITYITLKKYYKKQIVILFITAIFWRPFTPFFKNYL